MKIDHLSANYHPFGIKVENVSFHDTLSLLVGISGVGKTTILNVIQHLVTVAKGKAVNGFEWEVNFTINNNSYEWSGAFSYAKENPVNKIFPFLHEEDNKIELEVKHETLIINKERIAHRNGSVIFLNNTQIVRLSPSESIINLLRQESTIQPIFEAFGLIRFLSVDSHSRAFEISATNVDHYILNCNDIASIRNNSDMGVLEKLYICQEKFKNFFEVIIQTYKDIFPYIEDVKIDRSIPPRHEINQYTINIKELGIDHWIAYNTISSGMLKTFYHLVYVYLSPIGTIFLIDEFENGFGINCINSMSEWIYYVDDDYQFILTSHHPYIINKIPVENWKIINRDRNIIKAYDAKDYIDSSNHDSFIKLINTDFYKKGIYTQNNSDDWTEEDFE